MLKLYDKNYVFYIRCIFKSFDNFMHSQNIQITFYLKFNKYKYKYKYIYIYLHMMIFYHHHENILSLKINQFY